MKSRERRQRSALRGLVILNFRNRFKFAGEGLQPTSFSRPLRMF